MQTDEAGSVRIPQAVQASKLSLRAKGVLVYLAGCGQDGATLASLVRPPQDGRARILSAMKELTDAGYAEPLPGRDDAWRLSPAGREPVSSSAPSKPALLPPLPVGDPEAPRNSETISPFPTAAPSRRPEVRGE